MKKDFDEDYVRRVREETQRYTRDLLEENQKLRAFAAMARQDLTKLQQEVADRDDTLRRRQAAETRLAMLESEKRQTEEELRAARSEVQRYALERASLDRQLQAIEAEGRRYLEQYISVEQQNANLANLYVASFRLHSTLDRPEVVDGIKEIIVNLVGSEELAILEFDATRSHLQLIGSFGIDEQRYRRVPAGRGIIGDCLRSGEIFVAPDGIPSAGSDGESMIACIPLKVHDVVIGVIAIFRLLGQKSGIEDLDRELFNLLATHAATALYCASLHAAHGPAFSGVA
ncbi:MAG: GAF domain-containing protein [Thermoanaerobaculia bacterium]